MGTKLDRLGAILSLILVSIFSVSYIAEAGKPGVSTLTVPDGVVGGFVTGVYSGDRKALSDMGGVFVNCYAPDLTGSLVYENGFAIEDDGTVLITPLADWGESDWVSGPADCVAVAGYFTFPHENKYHPGNREWISLASDTFHADGV